MPQDNEVKHAHEHEDKVHKEMREDKVETVEENLHFLNKNDDQIHSNNASGHGSGAPSAEQHDLITGDKIKHVYELLPNWHKDQLRRLEIVAPGTQLHANSAYIDLHAIDKGEFRAKGDEVVHTENQLLVSKKDTDYETYHRLVQNDV